MFTPALKICELRKRYKKSADLALKNINLVVQKKSFFALLGANGAGKSTLIGIVASLITKTSGCVEIFGYDLERDTNLAKQCIGLVPQEFNFNQFETPEDILVTQAGYYGIPRKDALPIVEYYLEKFSLTEFYGKQVRRMSGGLKRRLMFARALLHRPQLLILDEPTAGLDIESRMLIWELMVKLNKKGVTVILTTHYLEEAERLCKTIAIIKKGELVVDTTMVKLLARQRTEVYTIRTQSSVESILPISISNATVELRDATTLEVSLRNKKPIHEVLDKLSYLGVKVNAMRSSPNRLETLFLDIVRTSS